MPQYRNHAFRAFDRDWKLSPAYDLTPSPVVSQDHRDLRDFAALQLNPARHMQGLHSRQGSDTHAFAPSEKLTYGPRIGASRMRIADLCREELEEAQPGPVAGGDNQSRK
jgi:hypothetical protein